MAEIRTVTTLRSKRNEIQAAIASYEKRLAQARADLAAIAAAIKVFEMTGEAKEVSAYTDLHRLFKRGETTALCREALAQSGQPMTTRELARYVMERKGLDPRDAVIVKAVALRLVHGLAIQCGQGKFKDAGRAKGGVRIWALHR